MAACQSFDTPIRASSLWRQRLRGRVLDQIDEETNERVIALADMLATRPITGVVRPFRPIVRFSSPTIPPSSVERTSPLR